jgi:hypothetical protein
MILNEKLKLRVFHRTTEDITLLWSTLYLTEDQKNNVQIICGDKKLKFAIKYIEERQQDMDAHTVICVINHETNGLQYDKKYEITIILGGKEDAPLTIKTSILEYGVLPSYDKENKKARVHLMGFDEENKAWTRLNSKRHKDSNTLKVYISNIEELAESIADKIAKYL